MAIPKRLSRIWTGEIAPSMFKNDLAFDRVSNMALFQSFEIEGPLGSIDVDSSGTYLLGGEEAGRVVLYDLARIGRSPNCKGSISLCKAYPNKPCPSPMDVNWFPENPGMFSTLSCGVLKFFDANSDSDDPMDEVDTTRHSKFGWPFSIYKHHPWNSAAVIGMSSKEIKMYDLRLGAFVQTLPLPPNADHFTQFAISKKLPTTLAASIVSKSLSGDSFIMEFDGRNWSQVLKQYTAEAPSQSTKTSMRKKMEPKYAHSRSVSYLAYSTDGLYLYSHSIDGVLKKWCTELGVCLRESRVPGKILYNPNMSSMAITDTNPPVAVVPRKNSLYLINIDKNELLQHLKGHVTQITDVKYDPVFNRVYSVAKEHMLLVWESKGSADHDSEAFGEKKRSSAVNYKLFDSDSDDELAANHD